MTWRTTDTTPAGAGGYLPTEADEGRLAFGSPHLFEAAASRHGTVIVGLPLGIRLGLD